MFGRTALWLSLLVCAILLSPSLSSRTIEQRFQFANSDVYIRLVRSAKLKYSIMKGSELLQTVAFDNFYTDSNFVLNSNGSYTLHSKDSSILFELIKKSSQVTHLRVSRNFMSRTAQPMDCIDLGIGQMHWYGGPQDHYQYYPVERMSFTNYSYLTKESHNAAVAERYWLNSRGVFFYVGEETPLFIDQNSVGHENQLCFSARLGLPYSQDVHSAILQYQIGIGSNAKVAHMYAVANILGKPTGHPDERMVEHPIWSTWAIYKANINDHIVRDFGNAIIANQFNNSQLEIDDDWEDCYGSLTFRKCKFPNIKKLTGDLKAQGFRVTLWIHPFINKDCTATYVEAKAKGFLVLDHNNNSDTEWWNSNTNEAAYIDFSKPAAVDWFVTRLRRLQTEEGIDSFKFDAGETSWVPPDPVLQGSVNFHPSTITRAYVKAASQLGPMVEVRTGQGTQNLPIFVRMLDKDSGWSWNNGIVTLITTLLQLNMNGYPFVLPDMIGGNGYGNSPPTKELFIRWVQANVFMPSMQFSFVPWIFDAETIQISQKFTSLHSFYTPMIMERFKLAVRTGEPVNPPLWWADPEDEVAQGIFDEFLLGDKIIAAPVVADQARQRDVYLPKGSWKDGNTGVIYKGPLWLMEYPAPLDVLPYFVRQD